jgi:hypothetical protein
MSTVSNAFLMSTKSKLSVCRIYFLGEIYNIGLTLTVNSIRYFHKMSYSKSNSRYVQNW